MTDLRRMEEALQNAANAGDTAAAQAIAAEIRNALQRQNPRLGMPDPVQLGQEGMPAAIRAAVREESRPAQAYAGAGGALAVAAKAVDQFLPRAEVMTRGGEPFPKRPQPDTSLADWQSLNRASPDAIGGNILGNAALFGSMPTRVGGGVGGLGLRYPLLASRTGMVADSAITGGLLNAAATPGDFRERANAGVLGMTGAAVPAVYASVASARRATTRAGKRIAVGEGLRAELGDAGSERLLASLESPDPGTMLGVQSSAAMRSGEPTLEVLEQGSRASRGDLWRDFDRQNAASRWSALTGRAGTPEELGYLRAERDRITGLRRDAALGAMGGEFYPTGRKLEGLAAYLDDLSKGAHRPNKDVQTLVGYVRGELDKGVTPEQLYTVRKVLTDGIKSGSNSELSQAARAARPQRVELIGKIDDVLNDMSGGEWQKYLDAYKGASPAITSKEALQNVVSSLERGQPTGTVPSALGESAAWRTVGNLRDRFGQKQFGSVMFDRLLPEDRALLETLVDNLKRQSDVMSARGVLGSHTAPLLANAQRAGGITGVLASGAERAVPFGGVLSAGVFNSLGRKAEEELARLLQDPRALAEALEAAKRAQLVASGASRAGAAAGAGFRAR